MTSFSRVAKCRQPASSRQPEVAGAEEALGVEGLAARHLVVAFHQGRTLHEDLARSRPATTAAPDLRIDDPDLHAGERRPNVPTRIGSGSSQRAAVTQVAVSDMPYTPIAT